MFCHIFSILFCTIFGIKTWVIFTTILIKTASLLEINLRQMITDIALLCYRKVINKHYDNVAKSSWPQHETGIRKGSRFALIDNTMDLKLGGRRTVRWTVRSQAGPEGGPPGAGGQVQLATLQRRFTRQQACLVELHTWHRLVECRRFCRIHQSVTESG